MNFLAPVNSLGYGHAWDLGTGKGVPPASPKVPRDTLASVFSETVNGVAYAYVNSRGIKVAMSVEIELALGRLVATA